MVDEERIVFSDDKTLTIFNSRTEKTEIKSPIVNSDQLYIERSSLKTWEKLHKIFTNFGREWKRRETLEDYGIIPFWIVSDIEGAAELEKLLCHVEEPKTLPLKEKQLNSH